MSSWDVELERDILCEAVRNPGFVRRAVPLFKRHVFSNPQHQWIWGVVFDCYTAHKEVPGAEVFLSRLEHDFATEEAADLAADVLLKIRKRRSRSPLSSLDELRRIVKMAALRAAISTAQTGLIKSDILAAQNALIEGASEVRGADAIMEPSIWSKDYAARLKSYIDGQGEFIPTPLDGLNEVMAGGVLVGNTVMVMANTHVGKSSFAAAWGFRALLEGCAVAHVTTEETQFQCEARYDAAFTGIERKDLFTGRLTETQRDLIRVKFDRRASEFGTRLKVIELAPGEGNIGEVTAFAEEMRVEHPDLKLLIVVDSADHLRPLRKAETFRLETSSVYWTLRAISLDPVLAPCVIVTTTQAGRKAEGRQLKNTDVSESYDKSRTMAVVLGMTTTQETVNGRKAIEIECLKDRATGQTGYRAHVSVNFGTSDFRQSFGSDVGSVAL